MRWFGLCLCLLLPASTQAAVYISEVAWMGTASSANHEWIELFNDSEEIDVTGWTLNDGMNLTITLAGVIPANSYVVLERNRSDGGAVISSPFLIYTGALVNTGATLRLLRTNASLVDQVAGGEDWKNIGGDNITKETAQYTSKGWVTAVATPGQAPVTPTSDNSGVDNNNLGTSTPKTTTPNSITGVVVKKGSSGETVILELPDVSLALKVKAQTIGYVHQPISFKVEPAGIGDTLIDSLEYQWNFGDGLISTTKDTEHIFDYPGTYLVTIYAGFKRQEQVARHEITILPVATSLTMNQAGDIQINNDSPYEINISGYQLVADKEFVFPNYSILLPKQTVTIPSRKLGSTKQRLVAFYDTEAALVASVIPDNLKTNIAFESKVSQMINPQPRITAMATSKQSVIDESDFTFSRTEETSVSEPNILNLSSSTADSQLARVIDKSPVDSNRLAYLGLVLVICLGIFSVYATNSRGNKV